MTALRPAKRAARMGLRTHAGLGRFLALLAVLAIPAAHAEDASEYAARLAELRADVASLNEAIEMEKEDQRGQLRGLDAQKAELQAQIRREELRVRQLQEAVAERETLLADDSESADELVPVITATLTALKTSVNEGLPYRVSERLAAIEELETKLADGSLRPQRAAARTWQFVEDELRLTRENTLDRQIIEIDGEDALVEVARVGMVAMYFRTDDGRVGRAVGSAGNWSFETYAKGATSERVEGVFDALTKQIRAGWFELPVEAL
ncbi:MAG: DUF3450 family protein [Deltaproteobacteria bacterium]|nr:MAG: DUF3450 family protein [Deltaproteobacteria bacterium]